MGAWFGFFIHRFFVLPAGWEGRASARPRASRRLPLPVLRETNHRLEGERPCEPPSALRAEGKWCRDPRTARPLSPHSRSRAKNFAAASGIPRDAAFSAFDVQRWAFGVHKTAAWNAARTGRRLSLTALREPVHRASESQSAFHRAGGDVRSRLRTRKLRTKLA